MNILKMILVALLLTSCATTPTKSIKDSQRIEIDGAKFELILPSEVKVRIWNSSKPFSCGVRDWANGEIQSSMGQTFKGEGSCYRSEKVDLGYEISFKDILQPGKYEFDLQEHGNLTSPYIGSILPAPVEPERNSDADQTVIGATALQLGANRGTLSPGEGDLTDWWKLEVPQYTKMTFIYQHNNEAQEVAASLYRLNDNRPTMLATLRNKIPLTLDLEGAYAVKITGLKFGTPSEYSISLAAGSAPKSGGSGSPAPSSGTGAPTSGGPLDNLNVLDSWSIDESTSAVLVAAGAAAGVKSGDFFKIFRKSDRRFILGCKVIGVAPEESECHFTGKPMAGSSIFVKKGF